MSADARTPRYGRKSERPGKELPGRRRVSENLPLTAVPVAATLVLFPSTVLAFFPAPAVWMDVEMDARRIDVSVRRVPAVAVSVANDSSRCVQRRHADQRHGRSGQNKQLRSGVHECSSVQVTSSNVLGRGGFQKLPSQRWVANRGGPDVAPDIHPKELLPSLGRIRSWRRRVRPRRPLCCLREADPANRRLLTESGAQIGRRTVATHKGPSEPRSRCCVDPKSATGRLFRRFGARGQNGRRLWT